MEFIKDLKFDEKGLIPAVAQDAVSGEILMLAYMNEESIKQTIETGHAVYFSRSRQELWEKGATSGNIQNVVDMYVDCDRDAIVLKVINRQCLSILTITLVFSVRLRMESL